MTERRTKQFCSFHRLACVMLTGDVSGQESHRSGTGGDSSVWWLVTLPEQDACRSLTQRVHFEAEGGEGAAWERELRVSVSAYWWQVGDCPVLPLRLSWAAGGSWDVVPHFTLECPPLFTPWCWREAQPPPLYIPLSCGNC